MRVGRPFIAVLFALTVALAASAPLASAQGTAAPPPWGGWARCQVDVQGPGYTDQQTHTWTITGGLPTIEGAFRVYAGTWTVVGGGSLQRSQGAQTLRAEWATNGPAMNAPIAVFVRASDGRMLIQARHAQLRAAGAIQGYQQVTIDGVPQTPGVIAAEAFEWTFPLVDAPSTSTTAAGLSSPAVSGSVGPMQPAGSNVRASCTWQFGQGSAAPAPPPTLAARAVPTPAGPGSGPPPAPAASAGPPPAPPPAAATNAPPPSPSLGTAPVGPVTTTSPPPASAGTTATAPQAVATTPPSSPAASASNPQQPMAGRGAGASANALPGATTGGGLSAVPAPETVTAATAQDPTNFTARQTAEGTVVLTWSAVAGAGSYMIGGPGTNAGITVNGTSQTLTGIPQGGHTWTVATIYDPGGILTTSDRWSRATTTVTNSAGRYRVVMAGFRVHRPTFDERINGNGDEVYAAARVMTIDRRNDAVLQSWTVVKSDNYGDVGRNPGYVQAGSMTPTGGLRAGDVVPAGTDPRLASGTPSSTRLPMLVWEGMLRDGIDVVVVTPTLWEIDGQLDYYNQWVNPTGGGRWHPQLAAEQTAAIKEKVAQSDLTPFRGVDLFNCASASTLGQDCSPGNDRPIGINLTPCNGTRRGLAWCDETIVITREGIERALASTARAGGVPPNIVLIRLTEPEGVDAVRGGLDGSYELYMRVERAP
jgi:hypothetical protein